MRLNTGVPIKALWFAEPPPLLEDVDVLEVDTVITPGVLADPFRFIRTTVWIKTDPFTPSGGDIIVPRVIFGGETL